MAAAAEGRGEPACLTAPPPLAPPAVPAGAGVGATPAASLMAVPWPAESCVRTQMKQTASSPRGPASAATARAPGERLESGRSGAGLGWHWGSGAGGTVAHGEDEQALQREIDRRDLAPAGQRDGRGREHRLAVVAEVGAQVEAGPEQAAALLPALALAGGVVADAADGALPRLWLLLGGLL